MPDRKTMAFILFSIAAAAVPSGSAASAAPEQIEASQQVCSRKSVFSIAQRSLEKTGIVSDGPGVTLAVYAPLLWREPVSTAKGWADFETKTPIEADARMLAGSIGKTLYAAAALSLADKGRLDLDRAISHYLPSVSLPNADVVTVRQLLSHTSGYTEYDEQFIRDLIAEPLRRRTLSDWAGPLHRGKVSPPGTYRYSDINFVLLAKVIDRAAAQPAEKYITANFLKPYGLDDTRASDQPALPGLVPGYAGERNFFGRDEMLRDGRLIYNPQFESGGGGFMTTAPDLSRWIALFALGNFFSQDSWQDASRPRHIDVKTGRGYGLGIHVNTTKLGTVYGHSGYIPGYYSWARWYPNANVSIAIQVNSSDDVRVPWDGFDIADELAVEFDGLCNR